MKGGKEEKKGEKLLLEFSISPKNFFPFSTKPYLVSVKSHECDMTGS